MDCPVEIRAAELIAAEMDFQDREARGKKTRAPGWTEDEERGWSAWFYGLDPLDGEESVGWLVAVAFHGDGSWAVDPPGWRAVNFCSGFGRRKE